MEQTQNKQQSQQLSAFSFFKKAVFAVLKNTSVGCLTMVEDQQTYQFGDINADLQATVIVNNQDIYRTLLLKGSIGIAEDFVAGKWHSPELTRVIEFFVANQASLDAIETKFGVLTRIGYFLKKLKRRNNVEQAKQNILAHYDLGNHLYQEFLDPHMQYSSAIYPDANTDLDQAQQHKLDTICQRLQLRPGDNVMEIGTGWGGLAIDMAKHYQCQVTTTTISDAQHHYAQQKIKEAGLEDSITLLQEDYRQLTGQYDKLVSIEMIEAVGHEYLDGFFQKCNSLLKRDGLMLIQAITIADQRYDFYRKDVDFIQTYIFPGGCLPSIERMTNCISQQTDMVMHQLHDIGLHYANTLKHWRERFLTAWPQLQTQGFDEQFKRLWLYYLCYCEGGFLQRAISTVHLTARKPAFQGE
ncbi:MAG: class I SAM-dependent methyltransferase [Aestuariibacter sp.]